MSFPWRPQETSHQTKKVTSLQWSLGPDKTQLAKKLAQKNTQSWAPVEKVFFWDMAARTLKNKPSLLRSGRFLPFPLSCLLFTWKSVFVIASSSIWHICIYQKREKSKTPFYNTFPTPQVFIYLFSELFSFSISFGSPLIFSLPPIQFKQCSRIPYNPLFKYVGVFL